MKKFWFMLHDIFYLFSWHYTYNGYGMHLKDKYLAARIDAGVPLP